MSIDAEVKAENDKYLAEWHRKWESPWNWHETWTETETLRHLSFARESLEDLRAVRTILNPRQSDLTTSMEA